MVGTPTDVLPLEPCPCCPVNVIDGYRASWDPGCAAGRQAGEY